MKKKSSIKLNEKHHNSIMEIINNIIDDDFVESTKRRKCKIKYQIYINKKTILATKALRIRLDCRCEEYLD